MTGLLVFLLTTSFYVFTLSPSLAWGDGVRLQSEVISGESFILNEMTANEFIPDPFPFSRVGVTAWDHPLYIVAGHLLVRAFPFVDSLWLVNLISALFGAASVTLLFLLAHQHTHSFITSGYAAFALAVSHTFWWHSSTPEVYTLFVFLLLLSLYFFEQFETTHRTSSLMFSAFFFGLSASDHLLAFIALPALSFYLVLSKKYRSLNLDARRIFFASLAFILGFSIYIIQFIRLTKNFSIAELMGPATGTTFLENLGTFSLIALGESLTRYGVFLTLQFGMIGILFGIVGIRKALNGADQKFVLFFIAYALFGILYRVSDQFAFFLTSYVFFALLMGLGATHILSRLATKPRLILTFILILTIGATPPFYRAIPRLAESRGIDDSFLGIPQVGTGVRDGLAYYIDPNKRGDILAYEFGDETITNLPPHSLVIAEWYTDTDE
ncbi:MAG TPA: DUF2723 domain-containing protein, partial [Anaerolineales bacterium]|nr:DUF2723 domain-containing protein [Anaerolineales bacterium]